MICTSCGSTNEDGSKLCVICGEILAPSLPQPADMKEQVCPECGHKGESWLGLCPKCGALMIDTTTMDQENINNKSNQPSDNPISDPESLDSAGKIKSEEINEWEKKLSPSEDSLELWTDEIPLSQEETSMKQVNSTLDTLLSDLLEIEIREKERHDLLEELAELPSSLYAEQEETPKKRKISLRLPVISTQTRSMLEWFLIFTLIFTLFIFGISAGLWSSIQLL